MVNQYLPPVIATPSTLLITAMTNANPMVITATVPPSGANTYIAGQNVRLLVPRTWGMYQANNLTCQITQVNGLNFTVNVNSLNFDPFIYAISSSETPASMAPAGSRNLQYNNNTDFVPFQSLNNIGN
jgi:hypothetical protein